jgi:hypothetical protein
MTTPVPDRTPTAWFLAKNPAIRDGQPTAAARWYWPGSTKTEKNTVNGDWVDADLFDSLQDDPTWVDSTEAEANTWVAGQTPSAPPVRLS